MATESVESTSVFKTSKMVIGGNGANSMFLPLLAGRSGIQNPDTVSRQYKLTCQISAILYADRGDQC